MPYLHEVVLSVSDSMRPYLTTPEFLEAREAMASKPHLFGDVVAQLQIMAIRQTSCASPAFLYKYYSTAA